MSRDKQIEEMAKATMKYCKTDNRCGSCHWSTCNECMSEVLYNAGYRKQIDGEWVRDDDEFTPYICSNCRGFMTFQNLNFCPECGARMRKKVRNNEQN